MLLRPYITLRLWYDALMKYYNIMMPLLESEKLIEGSEIRKNEKKIYRNGMYL